MKNCPKCGELLPSDNSKKYDDCKKEIFIIIIALMLGSLVLGIFIGIKIEEYLYSDNQKMDTSIQFLLPAIQDAGQMKINQIVNQTSNLGQNSSRLDAMAELIKNDFTSPDWNNAIYNQMSPTGSSYLVDKRGRIRQNIRDNDSFDLSTIPDWVAFERTGKCEEMSVLFYAVATKAGFDTHVVGADGIGHWWNEVKINNDWKYFDLQRYGEVNGVGDQSQWFGNRSDYSKNVGYPIDNLTKSGVCVHDLQKNVDIEDITDAYDPLITSMHGRCKVVTI
jgi:hypothetical protein